MKLSKKQEYELLASISGRGEVPVKFIYLDEGAQRWDQVYGERSDEGGLTNVEIGLLLNHIQGFLGVFSFASGINLIDLGCGNGHPAIQILKRLVDSSRELTYTAVDISTSMIDLAVGNIKAEFSDLPINQLLVDFENDSLTDGIIDVKQHNGFPNLMINLGNTLGNYTNTGGTLSNFMGAMTLDDYLLIGNGLVNDRNPNKILKQYNSQIISDLATQPSRSIGVYDDNDDFRYLWNADRNRVEGRIKLNATKNITLADQSVRLERGEEILVIQSSKYSEASLTKLLSDVGFRTELLTTTKDRSHILTLVQPTRYSVA